MISDEFDSLEHQQHNYYQRQSLLDQINDEFMILELRHRNELKYHKQELKKYKLNLSKMHNDSLKKKMKKKRKLKKGSNIFEFLIEPTTIFFYLYYFYIFCLTLQDCYLCAFSYYTTKTARNFRLNIQ